MSARTTIGEFEELVLLAVAAEVDDAYGLSVRNLLASEASRDVSLATVHSALYRLEEKGLLRSRLGGSSPQRGGRSRRLFQLTAAGRNALVERRGTRERIWSLIRDLRPDWPAPVR